MSERIFRCAVYTRKSSEEGLEQAFNSLDAQREAGIDYIKSQKHQGWVALPARYDDGGYSGGSMDRPGLQRLLADIQSRRVDVVVVYKVDRLSRSLADFARLMQTFDEHQVSFVSVTQQFNTTTSMDLRSQLPEKRDRWIRDSIHQVTLAPDRLTIEIERDCLRAVASEIKATKVTTSKNRPRERPRNDENGNSVDGKASVPMCSYKPEVDESGPRTTLSIRIQMKRLDGRRVLVSPDGDDLLLKLSSEGVPIPKEHFVRAIGQAFSWLRELSKSSISLADYCRRKGLAYTRADEILSLTNLSPKILHAALVGELQSAVRLDDLLAAAKHFDWTKQHELLRLA